MAGEITTQNTYLMSGATEDALTVLVPIKDYPDSGAEPEQIEVTDLSDSSVRRYISGLQDPGTYQFTVNYTVDNYTKLKAAADAGEKTYAVYFGKDAEFGGFQWKGQLSFWHVGKGVNEVKELMVSISITSAPEDIAPEAA